MQVSGKKRKEAGTIEYVSLYREPLLTHAICGLRAREKSEPVFARTLSPDGDKFIYFAGQLFQVEGFLDEPVTPAGHDLRGLAVEAVAAGE